MPDVRFLLSSVRPFSQSTHLWGSGREVVLGGHDGNVHGTMVKSVPRPVVQRITRFPRHEKPVEGQTYTSKKLSYTKWYHSSLFCNPDKIESREK